jgi:hypothetical protein
MSPEEIATRKIRFTEHQIIAVLEVGDPADCVFKNKTDEICRQAVVVLKPA